jgi:Methylenetetrahydrofolate reductase
MTYILRRMLLILLILTVLGMMPIQSYSSFERMTQHCRTTVPPYIWEHLLPIRDDDEAVKAYGVEVCVNMCNVLSKAGIPGFHFYTLNLEKSVLAVLKGLNIEESAAARRCAMCCAVQCCDVLYCAVLCSAVMFCTVLLCAIL